VPESAHATALDGERLEDSRVAHGSSDRGVSQATGAQLERRVRDARVKWMLGGLRHRA